MIIIPVLATLIMLYFAITTPKQNNTFITIAYKSMFVLVIIVNWIVYLKYENK